MRVYISKFVLILGAFAAVSLTGASAFFIWFVYQLNGPHYKISLGTLLVLCSIAAFFTCGTFALWWIVIRSFRLRNKAIVAFDENGVSYWTKNYKELVTTQYDEIRKVDIDTVILPKGSKFYLQIHKHDGSLDKIFLNNLEKSADDIFLMFKERCAHLTQPYSTVLLLV